VNKILLDTHVFIWYVNGNDELSKRMQSIIDSAIQSNTLYLAAISLWEVSMLDAKKRIVLEMPCLEWINRAIKEIHLQVLSVTPTIAVESCNLPGDFHGDPADRLIVATARAEGLSLLTCDTNIVTYGKKKLLSVINA
jgi:PIN domain nuclease of toxin-antitoxin system